MSVIIFCLLFIIFIYGRKVNLGISGFLMVIKDGDTFCFHFSFFYFFFFIYLFILFFILSCLLLFIIYYLLFINFIFIHGRKVNLGISGFLMIIDDGP